MFGYHPKNSMQGWNNVGIYLIIMDILNMNICVRGLQRGNWKVILDTKRPLHDDSL